ncbi:MAG: TonB family protein [Deltaproteobacteria bacterium]|jgi:TonB family protein|nr:TonB family protein [Deltaproteobacteria bacterium]
MGHALATDLDGPRALPTASDRGRLALFFLLAAVLHLGFFLLWGHLGLSQRYADLNFELPEERYLELALELTGPPDGPEAEPATATGASPEAISPEALPTETPTDQPAPPEEAPIPPMAPSANLVESDGQGPTPLPEMPDNTVSLEETAPEFKSYETYVRSAVARHWILPPEARSNFKPGRFIAVMTVSREGQILSIVVEESSNSSALDFAAMEALRGAAPYTAFPPELTEFSQLNFRLHFDYREIRRRVGTEYRPQ